jgi:chromosome segregation ATPase
MSSIRLDTLSSFGRLAVTLDTHFSELARLSTQIERLDVDSDGDLAHAIKLLNEFTTRAKTMTGDMQQFSQSLQETQARSEAATQRVADRARLIQERSERQQEIQDKLAQVKQAVKTVNSNLANFRKQSQGEFSEEEKRRIESEFEQVHAHLSRFVANAQQVREAAKEAKFKNLERDAQILIDTLESSRRKITQVLSGK